MKVTTLGIDLAKSIFRLHGVDARGVAVLRSSLPANSFCRSWRSFHHVWWEWRLVPERIFGRARWASLDPKRG
jgi:hypothetical protein